MPTPEPTQIELREERTWRVVTLCCESTEPDWHAAGQVVAGGDDVLVRLQGAFDGRCGWTEPPWEPTPSMFSAWLAERDASRIPRMELDGVPLRVRSWSAPPGDAMEEAGAAPPTRDGSWLGAIPQGVRAGDHALTVRYRECSWAGSLRIGRSVGLPPPAPVSTEKARWIVVPGYGIAMWSCSSDIEDMSPYLRTTVTAESRIRAPTYPCSGLAADGEPREPAMNVICPLDASGNPHGAFELVYTELKPWHLDANHRPVPATYRIDFVPIAYPPCDGLR